MSAVMTPTSDITFQSANIEILEQLRHGISGLDNDQYNWRFNAAHSSVGKHARHIIDHYLCFFKGSTLAGIHYDTRSRDEEIETNRIRAIDALLNCEQRLYDLGPHKGPHTGQGRVTVYISTHTDAAAVATDSSIERELVFLQAHTIHHMAIMRLLFDLQSIIVPDQFGTSPSTLKMEQCHD
ncbi:MAG: hypothetical protein ACJAR0_002212 [Candidatus Azotimanducaceae bacterium]|jgi:hypothetical protein